MMMMTCSIGVSVLLGLAFSGFSDARLIDVPVWPAIRDASAIAASRLVPVRFLVMKTTSLNVRDEPLRAHTAAFRWLVKSKLASGNLFRLVFSDRPRERELIHFACVTWCGQQAKKDEKRGALRLPSPSYLENSLSKRVGRLATGLRTVSTRFVLMSKEQGARSKEQGA